MNKKATKKVVKKAAKKVVKKAPKKATVNPKLNETPVVKKVAKKKADLKGTAEYSKDLNGKFYPLLNMGRCGELYSQGGYKTKAGAKKGLKTLIKNLGLKVEIKWMF